MDANPEAPPREPRKSAPADPLFAPRRTGAGLKRTAVRGVAVTFGGQALTFALGFGATAVLARLLTPEDFGLIAMTTVFTGFISMFSEAGLGYATVQRETITHEQVSTLLWVNVAVGLAIALLVAAASPVVAAFYREPRLTGITCALAVSFVFGGLTVQHKALMRRQLRFRLLVILDNGALLFGIAVGIAMAWQGWGYWSLVGMTVGTSVANAVAVWLAVPWRPGPPRRRIGMMPLLKFGGDVLSFKFMNYLSRNTDSLLIGWQWGAVALSFYDKAYRMLLWPLRQINNPLSAVLIPALSRIKSDPERFGHFYLRSLELLMGVTVPVVVGLAVFADEVVFVWLGSQWAESAVLFRLLTVAAVVSAMFNPLSWLLISLGQTRRYRWIGVMTAVTYITAFAIGLPFRAEGVAVAYSIATGLLVLPIWIYALREAPLTLGGVLRAFLPPLLAAGLAAGAAIGVSAIPIREVHPAVPAVLAMAAYAGIYALVIFAGFGRWRIYWAVWRELRGARSAAPPDAASADDGNGMT